MIAGKVWGNTELVEANGALEFHRIEMNKGGVCSKHLHEFKWNGFYVESGRMLVRVWQNDYDLVDETILETGMYTKVKPGVYHQFECLEDGVAFELYWAEFNHNDIVRETVGHDGTSDDMTFSFADTDTMSDQIVTIDESDVELTLTSDGSSEPFEYPEFPDQTIDSYTLSWNNK